ncbi:unnamed protein product [Calypogeia fissa]
MLIWGVLGTGTEDRCSAKFCPNQMGVKQLGRSRDMNTSLSKSGDQSWLRQLLELSGFEAIGSHYGVMIALPKSDNG